MGKAAFGMNFELIKHLTAKFKAERDGGTVNPVQGSNAWWMEQLYSRGGATGLRESMGTFEQADKATRRAFGETFKADDKANVRKDALQQAGVKAEQTADWVNEVLEGKKHKGIPRLIGSIAASLNNFNTALELATRTSAMKLSYEKYVAAGRSPEEAMQLAATIAKNISINFDRRGTESTVMNALFPFFNAAMQGTARLAATLGNEVVVTNPDGSRTVKIELSANGKKVLMALPAMGVIQAMLLAAAGLDDEELEDYVKERNFIIPLGDGEYVSLPIPLGFNTIFNVGREFTNMALYPDRAAKHLSNALMQPLTGFNPLGGAGNATLAMMPAALDIPVALMMNKDAFGRPIAKEDFGGMRETPGFTRAKDSATAPSRAMAEMINFLTGGSDYEKGAWSPTPDQIDYFFGQLGGGISREAIKAGSLVSKGFSAAMGDEVEETPMYRVPIAGRLYGDVNEDANVKSRLYKEVARLNGLKAAREAAIKEGDRETANEILAENPELSKLKSLNAYFKSSGETNKLITAAREEGDIEKVNALKEKQRLKAMKLQDEIKAIKEMK